ncbi:MAG: HEAT repeat domain-containing protein [Planctomycetota bacterium]
MARILAILLLLALSEGCSTGAGSALDADRRLELDAFWDLYQLEDPGWPGVRDRWYGYGGEERQLLIMSLVRHLVHSAPLVRQGSDGPVPGWKRPQRELLALGSEEVVPVLVEALRVGRDPASLLPISETLAGFFALEELTDLLDHPREGDSEVGVPFVMSAMVKVGGTDAITRVGRILRADPDWKRRSSAADALGTARYSDRERAVGELAAGFSDSDRFVVQRAIQATALIGSIQAAPRLAQLYAESRAKGDEKMASLALTVLRRLTGRVIQGDDPELWKQAARQAAESSR